MRTPGVIAIAFASLLVVAGCADDQPLVTSTGDTSLVETTAAPGDIQIETTMREGGPMFIEGALAEVKLVDSSGTVVGLDPAVPGSTFTFDDVAPGTYTLKAALRPCDGNCGYLDPPVNGCATAVSVDGDTSVSVVFSTAESCVTALPG